MAYRNSKLEQLRNNFYIRTEYQLMLMKVLTKCRYLKARYHSA